MTRITRWPAYVRASLAWHAGAAAVAVAVPSAWPWGLGAVVANHVVLIGAALVPRSNWVGRNWSRLPAAAAARGEVAITIDDGPDPAVTPAMLDILDAHRARATFFVIATRVAAAPELAREIVRRGHSVQNHSDRHAHSFSMLGPWRLAREIGAAQQRLAGVVGIRPRFFRAPAGLRNPLLAPLLERQGLELVSWTRRGFDTVRRDPAGILARLTRGLAAGDILLLHDGHAAIGANGRAVSLDVLPALLEHVRSAGLKTVTLPEAFAAAKPATAAASPARAMEAA